MNRLLYIILLPFLLLAVACDGADDSPSREGSFQTLVGKIIYQCYRAQFRLETLLVHLN